MRKLAFVVAALVATAAAAQPMWVVGPRPHGSAKFKIEGPLDDVTGETRAVSGTLTFAPEEWSKGKGVVAVELGAIHTGIDQRDEDMRTEFLQTKRFPFALLTIDQISRVSSPALKPGQSVEGEATGTFEIHGVRRTVKLGIKLRMEDAGRVFCTGKLDVPFADYNIPRPQRLFLKLGDTAEVSFEVLFVPKPAPAPAPAVAAAEVKPDEPSVPAPSAPTVAEVLPLAPPPKPKKPRKPKPALAFTFLFKGDALQAKGERLIHAPEAGGAGNKMTCFHCHAVADERAGLVQKDGHARAANTLYNAAQRPHLWGGFAPDVGKAASICQKQFMRGSGLTAEQEGAIAAFVAAISPDPAPEVDMRTNYRSMETLLRDPTGGDMVRGKALADKFCMTCHLDGRVGPVWAPGLYEPDWVVRRVRRLEGHQNKQMPNFTIARLPDTDLRDIVTYLTSPKSAPPVFQRKPAGGGGGKPSMP